MKPNFLKDKESSTAVLEKQTVTEEKQSQTKQEKPVTKPSFEKVQKSEAKINLFSAKAFEDAKQEAEKQNVLGVKKQGFVPIIEPKEVVKPQQEELVEPKEITPDFEEEASSFGSFSGKPKQKKKEWKFRVKLLTIVYCAVVAVTSGWVVTNAIRISQLNNTIQTSQNIVNASDIKYVQKIQELENLKDQEPNYENSELIPIEEFITVTPRALEDITEYEIQSNWFDNMINWFGNLFGGH